jgi:chromosome segregation ATPase
MTMESKKDMDKKPKTSIVAERDDMIGRNIPESRGDGPTSRNGGQSPTVGMSGLMKFILMLTFFGLIATGVFGGLQYQDLSAKHESLLARFDLLESRLSSTDESVTQSGAAMQLNISKHSEELKKHWSEIRKLWGVTNDINKTKIADNKKDIAFLAAKRVSTQESIAAVGTRIDEESTAISDLSVSQLGLSADIDKINEVMREYVDELNRLKAVLSRTDRDQANNAEAMEAIEGFRRQITQKIYQLEQRLAAPAPKPQPQPEISPAQPVVEGG